MKGCGNGPVTVPRQFDVLGPSIRARTETPAARGRIGVAVTTGVLPERYADPRLIGHGGMGEIFLAEDRELGRKVAVKVLAERFARDEALRSRFTREALAAARLSSEPGVVTIYDVGEWDGR